jgi:hypothetical protein
VGTLLAFALVGCAALTPPSDADARSARCPAGMTLVDAPPPPGNAFCIDRFEAALVEITPKGEEAPHSPYKSVEGRKVRAVSRQGLVPQAYISRNEADAACRAAKKRLCKEEEWLRACEGKSPTTFPYGPDRKTGYCNDHGKPPVARLYSDNAHGWEPMNDPRLNQLPDTVARTGSYPHCKSSWGAYDMMGNLHEWVDDPGGTFLGGYYLDTSLNGDGCHYKTVAHDSAYHDYSTGFRCCAEAR